MMKLMLAGGVAAVALTATPTEARKHYTNVLFCVLWCFGFCVLWLWFFCWLVFCMGYVFGPRYGYTAYDALPRTYVTRYHLAPRYRYVYQNGYIYQVDPTTYAVMRILNAF